MVNPPGLLVACALALASVLAPLSPATGPTGGVGTPVAAAADRGDRIATVEIASFNALYTLGWRARSRDAARLAGRSTVSVIGWQEADRNTRQFDQLVDLGWDTVQDPRHGRELAVSWRRDTWSLESSSVTKMHDGTPPEQSPHPGPARFVQLVTLRHLDTDTTLTVVNTHLNHRIEDWQRRPGRPTRWANARKSRRHLEAMAPMWSSVPGNYVVGTGDYNVDARADRRVRAEGFPFDRFRGLAVASYAALGTDVRRTHRHSRRHIDYVHLATDDHRTDAAFLSHRVLGGFRSDHRPIVARIALFEPTEPPEEDDGQLIPSLL